jgi:outer membrane protein OmpA-like peptidoglycan-associated protein
MNNQNRFLILASVLVLLSACAGPQNVGTIGQTAAVQPGPAEQVTQLEKDLVAAQSSQLDVLAPEWFSKAKESLGKAQKALSKGEALSKINSYVAEARASLAKAEAIAKVSHTILADTTAARQKALDAGAKKLGKPYMDVEKEYRKLTQAVENNNIRYAQDNAAKVQQSFRDIEIMAIKAGTIGNARGIMAKADRAKARNIAPQAYSAAEKSLKEADTYIGKNPYDETANSQKAVAAEFMVNRLMSIANSSIKFKEMASEDSALYIERLMERIAKGLNAGDVRNKSLEDQVKTLVSAAENLRSDNRSLKNMNYNYEEQIAALENQITGLKGFSREQETAKEKLAAERRFNELFDIVQGYFSPDEAEVYKQGGRLFIRLRGIKFPVGKSTLTPDNFSLMSKVQKAIQSFGQPLVTVEGHTDSTGSTEVNQRLSQERAEAVRAYLVANQTLPSDRISASGYGPDRPLASNATPEGRAVNRRIDVLIKPAQKP